MTGERETNGHSYWFVATAAIFTTCLIASNIIAVKLIEIRGIVLTAGIIIFPVSYIFGDILTEVYGYRKARRVIWLGFFCNLLTVLAIIAAQAIPAAHFWDGQAAFERILGYSPRILAASFIASLVGEFSNSYILAKLKIHTKGRWLWLRTTGSTFVGEGLDSIVFMVIAFAGQIPLGHLAFAILAQWIVKSLYEVLATPLTYLVVGFLKRRDQSDVYDYETRFNPLLISD